MPINIHAMKAFTIATLVLVSVGSRAAEQESSVSIYSDLCIHPESGDLIGNRVAVMRFKEADYALFQTAEGEFVEASQLGKAEIDSKSGDVIFRIPETDKSIATFKGKISAQLLTGTFDKNWVNRSGAKTFRLPKVVGRQQSFPSCK